MIASRQSLYSICHVRGHLYFFEVYHLNPHCEKNLFMFSANNVADQPARSVSNFLCLCNGGHESALSVYLYEQMKNGYLSVSFEKKMLDYFIFYTQVYNHKL